MRRPQVCCLFAIFQILALDGVITADQALEGECHATTMIRMVYHPCTRRSPGTTVLVSLIDFAGRRRRRRCCCCCCCCCCTVAIAVCFCCCSSAVSRYTGWFNASLGALGFYFFILAVRCCVFKRDKRDTTRKNLKELKKSKKRRENMYARWRAQRQASHGGTCAQLTNSPAHKYFCVCACLPFCPPFTNCVATGGRGARRP